MWHQQAQLATTIFHKLSVCLTISGVSLCPSAWASCSEQQQERTKKYKMDMILLTKPLAMHLCNHHLLLVAQLLLFNHQWSHTLLVTSSALRINFTDPPHLHSTPKSPSLPQPVSHRHRLIGSGPCCHCLRS